jgi:hypothetical protein
MMGQTNDNLQVLKKNETLLCAAVGTASNPHGLVAHTVYGRVKTLLHNNRGVLNLSELN